MGHIVRRSHIIDFTSFLTRLDDATATNLQNGAVKIQTGWGYITEPAGQNHGAKAVTFPKPFTNVPIIVPQVYSYSPTVPTGPGNVGGALGSGGTTSLELLSNTGFTIDVYQAAAAGSITYFPFSWIAIGI